MLDGIDSSAVTYGGIMESHQSIHIPLYQRSFSWKSDQITALWSDMMQTRKLPDEEKTLFLGPAVFHSEENERGQKIRFLVDGQQRLTTLALVVGYMRHLLMDIDSADAGAVTISLNKLLFKAEGSERNKVDPDASLRMKLSKKDNNQFHHYVKTGEHIGYRTYLKMALETIESLIDESIETEVSEFFKENGIEDPDPETEKKIRQKKTIELAWDLDHMLNNVASFSVVVVQEPFDPLTVFESLNSKGMPLAQSDLVKNLLIQRVPSQHHEDVAREWDQLANELEGKLIDFLRYWYIAKHEYIRKKELYESIKKIIRSPEDVISLLDKWQKASRWYLAIAGEKAPPAGGTKLEDALDRFSTLGFRQATPILLGFGLRGDHRGISKSLPILSSLYVRLYVTASVRGSIFENRVEDICEAIQDGGSGVDKLTEEANRLIRQYCPTINWKRLRIDNTSIQKLLLIEINRHLEDETWSPPPTGKLEVEHILPQTRKEGDYPDIDEIEYDLLINHIGNLTLILEEDNPRCGNKDFDEKCKVYSEYDGQPILLDDEDDEPIQKDLILTQEVTEFDSWGPDEIEERAQLLADRAEKIWPAEF